MIKTGLVSVTFRKLSPKQVVEVTKKAGLEGIEWGGDIHVPHGDIKNARQVRQMTSDAGLEIPSYGSYYRAGESEKQNLSFDSVLETAIALKTKSIRVWAGSKGTNEADLHHRQAILDDTRRIAAIAKKEDINISFEYHNNSLTDTCESAYDLITQLDLKNVKIYWQPVNGMSVENNLKDLLKLLPFVTNIHVFHWWPTSKDRHLLNDGIDNWTMYMTKIKSAPGNRFAMIEFVKDDKPENLLADAETLRKLV